MNEKAEEYYGQDISEKCWQPEQNEYATPERKIMAILALDPAIGISKSASKSALVYADFDKGLILWDTFKPEQKKVDDRFDEILNWIEAFAVRWEVHIATRPAVYKTSFGGASRDLSELIGAYRGLGFAMGYTGFTRVSDNTVKAALCGSGKADKAQMLKFVKTVWPEAPEKEPDVIDAFGLAYFTHNRSR